MGMWEQLETVTHSARRRIGRRGASLMIFGVVDIAYGWSLLDPLSRASALESLSYRLLFLWIPAGAWAALWLGVAAVCFIQACCVEDRAAFGCAIGIKVMWALGLYGSWVVYDAPRAWSAAVVWIVLACLVSIISGWPEPPDPSDWPEYPEP